MTTDGDLNAEFSQFAVDVGKPAKPVDPVQAMRDLHATLRERRNRPPSAMYYVCSPYDPEYQMMKDAGYLVERYK